MEESRTEKYPCLTARTLATKELDEGYLSVIVRFDSDRELDGYDTDRLKREDGKKEQGYLWALFGKKKAERWECLQVGASVNDILDEICEDIEWMKKGKHAQPEGEHMVCVHTQFYKNTYKIPKSQLPNKRAYMYGNIRREYRKWCFCAVDIDEYLQIQGTGMPVIDEIVSIAKMNYAEALFAFETQAIYWNAYRSGLDMKALKLLLDREGL